ncbi:hypothetical protein A9Q99_19050 [Gammaproteobacteria bacterium 45_16_T64]|nr:hypothetical protein A9Q99_19050 [Gammaproteobacteria bacterium 45_16_T64]
MSDSPEDHFDIESLADLKDIMEEDFQMLIDTFIADSESKVNEIGSLVVGDDPEALRQVAHSIKGSSGNVCATALSEIARQLEAMGKDGDLSAAPAAYEALKVEFAVSREILLHQI